MVFAANSLQYLWVLFRKLSVVQYNLIQVIGHYMKLVFVNANEAM